MKPLTPQTCALIDRLLRAGGTVRGVMDEAGVCHSTVERRRAALVKAGALPGGRFRHHAEIPATRSRMALPVPAKGRHVGLSTTLPPVSKALLMSGGRRVL